MSIPSDIELALSKFGLQEFRPGQREVIEAIVDGHDCMCVMPTGGGKSLCFQLPSVIRSGLTIVVSPLIALMKDQVDSLQARGIAAALINSSLSASEQNERLQAVASGHYQLVYVAPERLRNSRFLEAIRSTPIQLLAVDEAHCISQWGHDFRPDYARIGQFRELLGGVQTVALTATATPRVREDIVNVLQLSKPRQFMSGFARPNLHFGVVSSGGDREKEQELDRFFSKEQGAGIIYCATRKRCDSLVDYLQNRHKLSVGAYHGGLLPDQRRAIQDRFMNDKLNVVVATNAFGMGIDKPDLRFVLHYNMPGSLEAYYQEAGRAGRDGLESQCVMLYSFQDRHIQEFFIDNSYPERSLIEKVYQYLLTRDEDPIELTLDEMRDRLGINGSAEAIGSCLQILARTGVLDRLEMGGGLAVVRIDSSLPTLVDLLPPEARVRRHVLRVLEKAVGDRRGENVFIHPRWLVQQCGMEKEAVQRALRELCKLDEFDYVPPFRGRAVHMRRKDLTFAQLEIDFANLKKRKDAEYDRLNRVVKYAQSPICRQSTIRAYFGDTQGGDCGRCDRCARRPGWPVVGSLAKTSSKARGDTTADASQAEESQDSLGSEQQPFAAPLSRVVEAIQRIHGRLGKILISQYLCGSQNAKVQKLNLHRLSGFGMLKGCRQADVQRLVDAFLAAGLLQQREVNRHRPTIEVAAEWMDQQQRSTLLSMVRVPNDLIPALQKMERRAATDRGSLPKPQRSRDVEKSAADEAARPVIHVPHAQSGTPSDNARAGAPAPGVVPTAKLEFERSEAAQSDSTQPAEGPDWEWTLMLFSQGHGWAEVMAIRQMSDEDVGTSLVCALKAGRTVDSAWLRAGADLQETLGQIRVLRELRRRSAAGVAKRG